VEVKVLAELGAGCVEP